MTITASGFGGGAGEMDDLPNCTQVVIGRRGCPSVGAGQPALVLETNLDDVTGEQLGYAVAAALEAGALDAWVSSVTMKKGRPGHVLHVLTDRRVSVPCAARSQRVPARWGSAPPPSSAGPWPASSNRSSSTA